MKNKILLKSFIALALILAFSSEVYASEVTGNLSSAVIQNLCGCGSGSQVSGTITNGTMSGVVGGGSGSEVGGTIGNGNISGTVGGGSTSSSSGGSSGSSGSVAGASTLALAGNPGQVLGAATTPGFPATSLGLKVHPSTVTLAVIIASMALLMMYSSRRSKRNA